MKLRSVRSLVIAPASTGSESRSRNAVISTAHTYRLILSFMKIYYLVNVLIQIASVLTSIFMMYSKRGCCDYKQKIIEKEENIR